MVLRKCRFPLCQRHKPRSSRGGNASVIVAGESFERVCALGGAAEMFQKLVEARDRLLAALGTGAPAPKPPQYAPKGARIIYRSVRPVAPSRLGSTRRLG